MESPARPKCVSCNMTLEYLGQLPLRTGGMSGGWEMLIGAFADLDERVVSLDIYRCRNCRKLEFYDYDLSLPER